MTATRTRAGHHDVTPYLMATDTERVITFLTTVFAGQETRRTLRSDGKIDHAEVQIGDSTIMLGEISTEWEPLHAALYIYVRDIEEIHRRALTAGAISYMAPENLPDGDRMAAIRDPFGNVWWIVARSQGGERRREEASAMDTTTTNPVPPDRDIQAIGRAIEAHIAAQWRAILDENAEKLRDAYEKAGDMAYGTYLTLLFSPVHRQLRRADLRAAPSLPGDFEISREWGVPEGNDEQRWMWSTIERQDGPPLGTIATITFHDHTQFRLPRAPQIIALPEIGEEAVVAALAARSPDFAAAREARIEIAEWVASLEGEAQR